MSVSDAYTAEEDAEDALFIHDILHRHGYDETRIDDFIEWAMASELRTTSSRIMFLTIIEATLTSAERDAPAP